MKKQIVIFGVILIFLVVDVSAQWSLTEVMYNPFGSDSEKEWVEFFGPPFSDDIKFFEDGGNHNLNFISGNCFADCVIIVADNFNNFIEEYDVSEEVLVYDSSWSSLSNTGETIGLRNDSKTFVQETYLAIADEGATVNLHSGNWFSGILSPGFIEESIEIPEFSLLTSMIAIIFVLGFLFVKKV